MTTARSGLNERTVKILYHNPSMSRKGQWAGERGRQLALAMEGRDTEFAAIPPSDPSDSGTAGNAAKTWLKARVPKAARGPAISLRLLQRGTVNTIRWSWRCLT